MPAFTYLAGVIIANLGGITLAATLGATGLAALTGVLATGIAYVTSRIINGNPNKGNNSSAGSQGGRIQVPPATNNKVPVLYGSAYMNGMISDARLISTDQKTNNTMFYCIVLSETCNDVAAAYTINDVYWNDLRLVAVDATTNAHKIKEGRKNVNDPDVNVEDFIDTNFIIDGKSLVEVRVYAGSTAANKQIYPTQASGNTQAAYDFWGNNDNSWTDRFAMRGLVFAIVKVTYNGEKGFTGLPNMTFNVSNSVKNPADVWEDYMTGIRYGAGIDSSYIDTTAQTAWKNFCDEDINYINKDGTTDQVTERYTINGVIDTNRSVKENIDIILQNGGAWMSYDVSTGLWSPVIKKAITAGDPDTPASYFTGSRSGTTLTVATFPEGRIESGQNLYNSTGTLIGTISAQITPLTAGETAGQKGRYTTSTSGTITTTTFYTTAPNLLSFSDDNIISGISISSTRLDDLYNSVEAEFYDQYNKDQKAYARANLPDSERNPNEPDNQLRLSLDLCNNSMQADILGQIEMRQSRDDLVIEFTSNQYGIQAQAGDVVNVYSDLYDWAPKLFRVMRVKEQETDEGGLVAQIQALECNGDVYTIEPITEFTTEANIGIGVYAASPNLPQPPVVVISEIDADVAVPNFLLQIEIPTTGGPYDEIELYYTEGWDPMSITGSVVPGTGSNGAPVGDGLLTVTAVDYGAINVGDFFTVGATNFIITEQLTNTPASKTFVSGGAIVTRTMTLNDTTGLKIGNNLKGTGLPSTGSHITAIAGSEVTVDTPFVVQAAGTYTVEGGLGTYVVDTSATLSGTTTLYDRPVDSDYKYLKKATPDGNNPTFTNGETVGIVITEVPANTQTYRRWFIKARMGIKKRFGAFSTPTDTDRDGNFRYTPNPIGGGGTPLPGVVSGLTVTNTTPFITFSTQADGANPMYGIRGKSTVDDPWFVGAGSTGDDQGYLELATGDNAGLSNSGGQIYVRQYNGATPGTGAPWFGGNGTVVNEIVLLDNVGNTYIPNNLTVDAGTLFVDSLNQRIGINNTSPSYELHIDNGSDSVTQFAMTNNERSFIITNNGGDDLLSFNYGNANRLQFNTTDQWFNTGKLGVATNTPGYTLDVNGDLRVVSDAWFDNNARVTGDLAVNGGDITTTQTTFNLLNATAATVNFANAGTAITIGATTGTTTIRNANTVVTGDLAVNGGDITTSQTTFNLLNTTATTVNAFGASTATAIGAVTGTTTIGNNLSIKGTNLILNSDGTGTEDVSILVERGVTDAYITWDEDTDTWNISNNVSIDNDTTIGGDLTQITSTTSTGVLDIEYKNIITTAIWAKYNNSNYYDPTTYRAIDQWDRTVYSSAKYILNVENTTDVTRYQIIECLVIGSSTPYITIYGDLFNDGSTIALATALSDIDPNLVNLNAYALIPAGLSGGITRITGHRILFAKAT